MRRFFAFLLSAVLLLNFSACQKETAPQPVLSEWDFSYSPAEPDEINFENNSVDVIGICGDVLFYRQVISLGTWRYFAANLQTAGIGTIGAVESNARLWSEGDRPVAVGGMFYFLTDPTDREGSSLCRFSLDRKGIEVVYRKDDLSFGSLTAIDGMLYFTAAQTDLADLQKTMLCRFDPSDGTATVLAEKPYTGGERFSNLAAGENCLYNLFDQTLQVYDLSGQKTDEIDLPYPGEEEPPYTPYKDAFAGGEGWFYAAPKLYGYDGETPVLRAEWVSGKDTADEGFFYPAQHLEKGPYTVFFNRKTILLLDWEKGSVKAVTCPFVRENWPRDRLVKVLVCGENLVFQMAYENEQSHLSSYGYTTVDLLFQTAEEIPLGKETAADLWG